MFNSYMWSCPKCAHTEDCDDSDDGAILECPDCGTTVYLRIYDNEVHEYEDDSVDEYIDSLYESMYDFDGEDWGSDL